jgi:hypothetical protein
LKLQANRRGIAEAGVLVSAIVNPMLYEWPAILPFQESK